MAAKSIFFGTKSIYLPTFTVALVRTPKLSPYQAKFQVPLNFSKFDLRDYLYHAYNVRALSIKSHTVLQPVRDTIDARRQFFRPESKKYMTIEMERPFVWPENPDSWDAWGKEDKERMDRDDVQNARGSAEARQLDMAEVRETARGYLAGARKARDGESTKETKTDEKKKAKMGLKEWERRRTGKYLEADEPVYKIRV